jgi:polar amino acid transport system substrate-binding protein
MGFVYMTIVRLKTGWRAEGFMLSPGRHHIRLWRMGILCLLCLSFLITFSSAVKAADNPVIRLCQDSEDVYPWTLKGRPGLNNILLNIVEAKTGVTFSVTAEPWKRCQEEMKIGAIDGMFAISFLSERQAFGVYPMRGTDPDTNKNLMIDGYSLYRRRGDDSVKWDGREITINGIVGVQRGYSVNEQLQKLNVKIDSGTYLVEDNLRKLIAGRVAALALRTTEGDSVLAMNREFSGKVEKLPIPLVEKPYYLIFSKQYAAMHATQIQDLWNMIERVRNSPEYKAMETAFR